MVYTLLFSQHKLTLMRRDRNKGRNDCGCSYARNVSRQTVEIPIVMAAETEVSPFLRDLTRLTSSKVNQPAQKVFSWRLADWQDLLMLQLHSDIN